MTEKTGVWDDETCEYCNGKIVEKRVTVHRKIKGEYVMVENVPAGVCPECSTRYYAANVLSNHPKFSSRRDWFILEE